MQERAYLRHDAARHGLILIKVIGVPA